MKTLIKLFNNSIKKFGNNSFFFEKTGGEYQQTSFKEMNDIVQNAAAGFLSLGMNKGDRIALFSQGRRDWISAELAMLFAGAVNVPLSMKLEGPDLLFRLQHSEARVLVVSDYVWAAVKDFIPETIEYIIAYGQLPSDDKRILSFKELQEKGAAYLRSAPEAVLQSSQSVHEDDCAIISYTSGTSAEPKGVMLSHKNLYANTMQSHGMFPINETDLSLLILPLDHSFAHTCLMYVFLHVGASLASVEWGRSPAEMLRNIPKNIKEIKPTMLLSVPALAKNFRASIERGIKGKGPKAEKLFEKALKVAYKYNGDGWNKGKGFKLFLGLQYKLFDKLLFSKIRENFGGKLTTFVGGGALLDIELQRFFAAIGITMFQGYGLTEASPVISANTPKGLKFGSSGKIVPDLDVKICDTEGKELPNGEKGEIVIRGENVMLGYYKNEQASKECLIDGRLHTGDMGYIDQQGYLYVLGRFKSLLIASDGEKYSPEGIESSLEENSPFINQVMLHNNQNPYTGVLISPNVSAIEAELKKLGIAPASDEGAKKAIEIIKNAIEVYKKGEFENLFPQRWIPSAFAILDEPFTEQNGFMNSTLKMVRGKITAHYEKRLDYMFTPKGRDPFNEQNLDAFKRLLSRQI